MITLITGGPGTGKTAWLLNELLKLRDQEKKDKLPPKTLFIHGVRNLRGIHHKQVFCKSQLCDICRSQDSKLDESTFYVETWPQWKQPDSIIIIDEVQRIWRPRGGTGTPPEDISLLETHRHYGVDFWLISQGPHLFDNFIRLLVGRHIHLVAKWSGRYEYEWPECKQNVQSRTDAVERPYKLPKRVYKLYDSAEVHTKQNKRMPLAVYGLAVAVVFFLAMAYVVYSRFSDRLSKTTDTIEAQQEIQQNPTKQPVTKQSKKPAIEEPLKETPQTLQAKYHPVIPSQLWTAPIFQAKANEAIQSFPQVKGCIKIDEPDRKLCRCYTQQSSIVDMPDVMCETMVKTRIFNPFKADRRNHNQEPNNIPDYSNTPPIIQAKTEK